ncbi:MAG: phosphoenolpyruvate--protein phosphotransferase [Anaerolineae bacterium]
MPMIGLVIVSHSAALAAGALELARGMAGPDVRIAATGGLALPDHPLGTDAEQIYQAIEQVYSDDGVLVLMDLGSAILSAEMALDMLTPEQRAHVLLCDAPVVEGAVTAAVQARLGSSLEQVAAEARNALAGKIEHLGAGQLPTPVPVAAPVPSASTPQEIRLVVQNRLGLHARPAARFVQAAAQGQADVGVQNLTTGRGPVNARSINAVATLGIRQGHEIRVTASGPDAKAVLQAVRELADANFGDEAPTAALAQPAPSGPPPAPKDLPPATFQGLPASPGIAMGPAYHFQPALPSLPTQPTGNPDQEWQALLAAIDKTRAEITRTRDAVKQRADSHAAAIFDAHLLFLQDPALLEPAQRGIQEHQSAARAWQQGVESAAAEIRGLDDEYLRLRAMDVETVGNQVLLNLLGASATMPVLNAPGILVAPDLTPAETAGLDAKFVLGICTARGAPTSHSAILARTLGIPCIVGLGEGILALAEGTPLIVDGEAGYLTPNPELALVTEYTRRAEAARAAAARAHLTSAEPALTRDGRRIEVAANIGTPADAQVAMSAGAEGVGLFRSEFLFLDRKTAPTEEEQYTAYRAAAEALGGRPLIIRTLDVGGDKPLPYLPMEPEANPFLGWRAIRLCLAQPDFFLVQLRAIVRVAAEFPVKVMFPMIATLDEWRAARDLLATARREIQSRGKGAPDRIETGIMVEIPAAALRASQFAAKVDFFSIGTNDLSQYTLAAERGNTHVAALADAFHPAVLQLIRDVVTAAHARGKWVGVCGELAGDPLATPLLVGLGVDELSMSPHAIPRVKQMIRELDYAATRAIAAEALDLETAQAVRLFVQREIPGI